MIVANYYTSWTQLNQLPRFQYWFNQFNQLSSLLTKLSIQSIWSLGWVGLIDLQPWVYMRRLPLFKHINQHLSSSPYRHTPWHQQWNTSSALWNCSRRPCPTCTSSTSSRPSLSIELGATCCSFGDTNKFASSVLSSSDTPDPPWDFTKGIPCARSVHKILGRSVRRTVWPLR